MKKIRLDQLLFEKVMVESRTQAQRLIMAGSVKVNGQKIIKPGTFIDQEAEIVITDKPKYVSRGGLKLEAALNNFKLTDLRDFVCVDVGASTGGFTDCLLQHNAKKVYAVDVGYGQLHWKIRNDSRVQIMERTNARYIDRFQDDVSLVTIDASFISLKVLLPVVKNWFGNKRGEVIALVKPQFEAGRKEAAKYAGVIRDTEVHKKVLYNTIETAQVLDFCVNGLIKSPIKGPKGNTEFLICLDTKLGITSNIDLLITQAISIKNEL